MLKSTFTAFLVFVLVGSLILVSIENLGVVYGATEVTGVIGSDTTWTLENSPYNITGPVLVSNGVTLTIESGVTVNFMDYSYYIQVEGTLVAKGECVNHIYFNNGKNIWFTKDSVGWNEQTKTGSIIENAILTHVSLKIEGAPKIYNNTISGSIGIQGSSLSIRNNHIDGSIYVEGGSPEIVNNTISSYAGVDWIGRPEYSSFGIGLAGNNNAYVSGNDISSPFTGSAIKIDGGTPTIERNFVSNTYGYGNNEGYFQSGITIYRSGNPLIQNNTITHSSRGITCYSSSATIIYNNIYDITNYNIYMETSATSDINAAYNWWGTTDTVAINQSIRDFKNDFNLGKVNFTPFLTEPNSEAAPTIPELPSWLLLPLFLVVSFVVVVVRRRFVC